MKKLSSTDVIACVAVAVIIVSLLSLSYTITGNATTTNATVNVTVESIVSINFTANNINFGAGSVTTGGSAVLYSENATIINGNWTSPSKNFTLENIGNANVSLQLATQKDAATFLGGTSPGYEYKVWETEGDGCTNTTIQLGERQTVNTTAAGTMICNPLEYVNSRDQINISIVLTVPSDAAGGAQGDVVTAIATAV